MENKQVTHIYYVKSSFVLIHFVCHDLKGGDSWTYGTPKVEGLSTFRDSFSRELNENENGFIYSESVVNASSRPFGTPYVNTSYAYVYKNAMFVTVDAFHMIGTNFYDKKAGEGGSGIVTCTVVGEHLRWFENVLKAAREDTTIDHIFVQAHLPILQPVRKINSSGQFIDKGIESEFWKLMQKYDVDIYFGGEVHSNTVTKDPESNLLQVITRGNRLNNFLKVDVADDGLTISSFNEIGSEWKWNGNYTKYGEIIINKAGSETDFQSSGSLEFLALSTGPLIWLKFDMDDIYDLGDTDKQIIGLKYNEFHSSLIGQSITIRNETSTEGMVNYGIFGRK